MAAAYRILSEGGVLRAADGAAIPPDPRNADWRDYQAWRAAGGVPDPAPEPPPRPPMRRIAPLAFRRRFGARRVAITLAASQALDAGDATLQTYLDDLASARYVDLDDPETVAGVQALVAAGLLTEAQAAAMLADGTPEEAEGLGA